MRAPAPRRLRPAAERAANTARARPLLLTGVMTPAGGGGLTVRLGRPLRGQGIRFQTPEAPVPHRPAFLPRCLKRFRVVIFSAANKSFPWCEETLRTRCWEESG